MHRPGLMLLCALLTSPLACAEARWPYYSPGVGTIGETKLLGQGELAPRFLGHAEGEDLVICSDLGRFVARIRADDTVAWKHDTYPEWGPQKVALADGMIVTAVGDAIVFLDTETGQVRKRCRPRPGQHINFAFPVADGYVIGFESFKDAIDNQFAKNQVVIWNETQGQIWANPVVTASARSAVVWGDDVVIAATFRNLVIAVSRTTGKPVWHLPVYSPCDLKLTPDGRHLLIAEEHANRIVSVDQNQRVTVHFAAHHPLFQDATLPLRSLIERETETIDPLSVEPGLSLAAVENSGRYTLYSPNGLDVADHYIYIADTDNHRIIKLTALKTISREISHVLNPTGVLILPH